MASVLLGIFTALSLLIWSALPPTLTAMGLHPHYSAQPIDRHGRRALIVNTSQNVLAPTSQATGVWASEMTAPYYVFLDAGMEVDLASIQGGAIPLEPGSTDWPVASPPDERFLADPALRFKVLHSLKIDAVDIDSYDIVFLAGGWGAAYDLGPSKVLGEKLTRAWARNAVIGGVCHGPLGLLQVRTPAGELLVKGRHLTAVSDKQIAELGIGFTPQHPERELRAAGALYEKSTAITDILAYHVVVDGRLVTGQNQNSGPETAYRMMELLGS
ncbi:MAG: type 1 glutamine amidotransferase domain-containing protein [Candidatus Sericytochromatia bacterium]